MSTPALAIQLSEAELRLLQALVYQECGMFFDARRAHFLQDRLQRRLRESRIDSFYNYYRLLISAEGKQELSRLLENLTVNETSFFRNKAHWICFTKAFWTNSSGKSRPRAITTCAFGARDARPGRSHTRSRC